MRMNRLPRSRADARGFSLVELMVGLFVSLIGTLVMFQAFALLEGQKRTTTSGSDAQQNGAYALVELERRIRSAGSGLVQGRNYGAWACRITAYGGGAQRLPSAGNPAPFSAWPGTFRALPVLALDGGANPDSLAVVGGNPAVRVFGAAVGAVPGGGSVVLANTVGIYGGDFLLGTGKTQPTCTLARAAAVDSATRQVTLAAADSPANSFVGAFNGQGYLFDLGSAPVLSLFGIDPAAQNLVEYDLLQRAGNGAMQGIAEGIVQLKVRYGVDDGAGGGSIDDNVVDEWVVPAGPVWGRDALSDGSAGALLAMARIKAVRVALVARSALPERDYTGPATVTLFPDLAGALRVDVAVQTQYRHKVFDTTVPIHNTAIATYF
ncbi:MAG TPA: PilW family protein [Tahibacter sp.]|nr:PilW family protein [Tahibacter sp.]